MYRFVIISITIVLHRGLKPKVIKQEYVCLLTYLLTYCAVLTPVFMQACTFVNSMNACTDYNHTTIYSVVAVRAQVR